MQVLYVFHLQPVAGMMSLSAHNYTCWIHLLCNQNLKPQCVFVDYLELLVVSYGVSNMMTNIRIKDDCSSEKIRF